MPIQNRVDPVVLPIRDKPLRLPGFVYFRCLEPSGVAFGAFGFSSDSDPPKIAGARLEPDRRSVRKTVDAGAINLATIEDDLLEVAISTYQDLGRSLYFIASILNDPGKGRFFYSEAQGVYNVVGLEMGYFHHLPHR